MASSYQDRIRTVLLYNPGDDIVEWLKAKVDSLIDLRLVDEADDAFLEDTSVVVGGKIPKRILGMSRTLKYHVVPWSGIDIINIEEIRKYHPQIQIVNSHGNALTVAEYALALLLTVGKRIVESDRALRLHDWRMRKIPSFPIVGTTLTILGFGAVAQKFIQLVQGFQCEINVIKRNPSKFPEEYKSMVDFIGGKEDLPHLLPKTDYLVVMLPLTTETKGYVGEKELNLLKETSILVNISRGKVIDEDALYRALLTRKIAGAALDVWYVYPGSKSGKSEDNCPPAKYPFWELNNVVMSPHRAYNCLNRKKMHWNDVLEALNDIARGKRPKNLVDLSLGY